MMVQRFAVLVLALLLPACGPIMGAIMMQDVGVKQFETASGNLAELHPGRNLLVFGPFAKTDEAFYICRGEDAAQLSADIEKAGLFHSELFLERNYKNLRQTGAALKEKTPEQLKAELALDSVPDLILFGTLTHRETTVAPAYGVIMDESFRLEFYHVRTRTSTVLEVRVRDLAQDCIPALVKELSRRLGRG